MITLNISSKINISTHELTEFYTSKGIKCQITETISSVPDETGNFIVERGFSILIFDIEGPQFKKEIWDTLQIKLDLKCAFVKYREDYMGCVLNWPGVFTESNCQGKANEKLIKNNTLL